MKQTVHSVALILFLLVLSVGLFGLVKQAIPAIPADYTIGVSPGHYVKLGNFVGNGSYAYLSEGNWTKFEVAAISGKNVTFVVTGQLKNGSSTPGSGGSIIYDVETARANGSIQSTGYYVIPANLTLGAAIPGTILNITRTENRTYFGIARTVVVATGNTSTVTVTNVYDQTTGMMLEVQNKQPNGSTGTFSVIETNILTGQTIPEISTSLTPTMITIAAITATIFWKKKLSLNPTKTIP